jgi:pseudaminic acid cytidylyltransferase
MRIAIIPARSGSTRIRNKNVHPICGRPMMAYPLAAAQQSGLFDKIHVSTDSEHYASIAGELGFPVDFLRPPDLSQGHSPMREALRQVLRTYDAQSVHYDEICMLYATAVLLDGDDLRAGHALFEQHNGQSVVLAVGRFAAPLERAMTIDADDMLRWRTPANRLLHSQDCLPAYFHGAAFLFFSRASLFDEVLPEDEEYVPYILPATKAVDIDEPEHLELAELLLRGRQHTEGPA